MPLCGKMVGQIETEPVKITQKDCGALSPQSEQSVAPNVFFAVIVTPARTYCFSFESEIGTPVFSKRWFKSNAG